VDASTLDLLLGTPDYVFGERVGVGRGVGRDDFGEPCDFGSGAIRSAG
jgi:hypothetical protein